MKKATELVILFLTLLYTMTTCLVVKEPIVSVTLRPIMVNAVYIKEIQGTAEEVQIVKKALDNFNKLGHNRIVKYSPTSKYSIPLIIKVYRFDEDKSDYAGFAYNKISHTELLLNSDGIPDLTSFEETVVHELLHIYGYSHSNSPRDIMYHQGNWLDKSKSLRRYAKELEEALYDR